MGGLTQFFVKVTVLSRIYETLWTTRNARWTTLRITVLQVAYCQSGRKGPPYPRVGGTGEKGAPNLTGYLCYGIKRHQNWTNQELILHISYYNIHIASLSNMSKKLIFTRPATS